MSQVMTSGPGMRILGTGQCLPRRRVGNDEIAAAISLDADWVERRIGIRERRVSGEDEDFIHLAAGACNAAIRSAGLAPSQIDMIILATASGGRSAPSSACRLQHALNLGDVPCFDVSAVCAGFLYAMTIASRFLDDACRHILVVGSDTFSQITDWTRRDCVFFGDGAGAMVISGSEKAAPPNFRCVLRTQGSAHDFFHKMADEPYWHMKPAALFDIATTVLPKAIADVLNESGLDPDDVDVVVPHQASITMLRAVAERSGISFERFGTNMDRVGNTVGATLPILLDDLKADGRLFDGANVLFVALGSGVTWGAAMHRWRQ